MLVICKKLHQIRFGQLMAVYEEGNRENGQDLYPNLSPGEQILRAEQDFYQYLQDDFFPAQEAAYYLWQVNDRYVSALRMEKYRDGLLLEALETAPDKRGRGYASSLIREVQQLSELNGKRIYSHVGKWNKASLAAHQKCGFEIIADRAVYIDGSVNDRCYTLCDLCKQAGA